MAMQVNYEAPNGVIAEEAYAYIKSLTEVDGDAVNFQLFVYFNKEAKENNKEPLDIMSLDFIPDVTDTAANYRRQGYSFLKTTVKFSNAIDVLEEGQTSTNSL